MLGHVYGIEHLSASAEAPLFFWSEAWFGSGRHCDPENTHKLCKDALFYLCPGPKDKHTGGAFAGPLYDLTNPRTEVRVWRLTVSSPIVVPKRVARKPDPVVEVEPTRTSIPTRKVVVPATKVANPFDMLKGRK